MILGRVFSIYGRYGRAFISSLPQNLIRTKHVTTPLRPKKAKSVSGRQLYFSDEKTIRTFGGKAGDGCISFLQLWCNERAGPDGGDGGNGGHIIFEASKDVHNLSHLSSNIRGDDGQSGSAKECHGKSGKHKIVKVPVGTIIRNQNGVIVGDLDCDKMMFVASRGGAGGKGNRFFTTEKENGPKVCEHGPIGEDITYVLEMRSMADIGIIGFPNVGKSTLLNAITRARPKVAPYAFTTLRPHIGMVNYADHFQLAVADLPGIITGSHRNKGLGLNFLKHIERCSALIYLLDGSCDKPWLQYENLNFEMIKFNRKLVEFPKIVVANKIDKSAAAQNLSELKARINYPVIGISAKSGTNLKGLLHIIRRAHENKLYHVNF